MLSASISGEIFSFLLVFTRLGTAMIFLPAFGEAFVPSRVRLLLALFITLVATPVVAETLPAMPAQVGALAVMLVSEAFIGVFIGVAGRVAFSALSSAGVIIGFHSGLASAQAFDPTANQQGAISGAILTVTAMVLLFITNMHHLMIAALVDSYMVFPAGEPPIIEDVAEAMIRIGAQSLVLAMQISAPFIILGTMINVCIGVMARLMPQIQVFFLALPLQIGLSFVVFMVSISAAMLWFMDRFRDIFIAMFLAG